LETGYNELLIRNYVPRKEEDRAPVNGEKIINPRNADNSPRREEK
jgi:hypothetical protein